MGHVQGRLAETGVEMIETMLGAQADIGRREGIEIVGRRIEVIGQDIDAAAAQRIGEQRGRAGRRRVRTGACSG